MPELPVDQIKVSICPVLRDADCIERGLANFTDGSVGTLPYLAGQNL
jgi:hypothetical protein